jgi:hypothetical protein
MEFIEYPTTDYNSWINEIEADEYFESRLNAAEWNTADKEVALQTAFRSLKELDLNIQFSDDKTLSDTSYSDSEKAVILSDLQQAQCEQALHELKYDLDSPNISRMSLGGLLSVNFPANQDQAPRYSERTLAILRPHIRTRTVTRTR